MRTTTLLAAIVFAHAAFAEEAPPKLTYDEHVKPILRQACFSCHNQDRKRSGLAVDTYAGLMEGSSGGEVVDPGDGESSRLYELIAHLDEPKMPPGDKLPDAQIALIKNWITGGALENAGSKVAVQKGPGLEMAGAGEGNKPKGEPAMPQPGALVKQPVAPTPRAAAVTALAASPWAPLVAVAGQRQIVLYHAETAELLGVLPLIEGVPQILRFSRNGDLLIAGGGHHASLGIVAVYDVKTGRRVGQVGDELDTVLAADVNNTHSLIALGGPQRLVRIYSLQTGELKHTIKKHTDWVYAVEFSPDGRYLASSDRSGGVHVWEADTAREFLTLSGHKGGVTDLSWRADSHVLATASEDGTVKLWDLAEGKEIKSIRAHNSVLAVEFDSKGGLATCGRDRKVRSFKPDGNPLRDYPGFEDETLEVCVTHDGKRVIAGDWTGAVRMFDRESGEHIADLSPNPPTLEEKLAAAQAAVAKAQQAADAGQAAAALEDAQARVRQAEADLAAFRSFADNLRRQNEEAFEQIYPDAGK